MNTRLLINAIAASAIALLIAIAAPEVAGILLVALAMGTALVVVSQSVTSATRSAALEDDKPRPFQTANRLQPGEQPQLLAELINEMNDTSGKSTRGATNEVLRQAIARQMSDRHGISVYTDAHQRAAAQLLGPRLWSLVAPNATRPRIGPHDVAAILKEIDSL